MFCPVPSPLPLVGGFVAGGAPAPTPTPAGFLFDLSLLGAGNVDLAGQTQSGNAIVAIAGSSASSIVSKSTVSPRGTMANVVGAVRCGGIGSASEKRWQDCGGTMNMAAWGGYAFGTKGTLGGADYCGYYFYNNSGGSTWTARKFQNAGAALTGPSGTVGSAAVTGLPTFGYQVSGSNVTITIYNGDGSVAGSWTEAPGSNFTTFLGFDLWNAANGAFDAVFGNVLKHNGTPS